MKEMKINTRKIILYKELLIWLPLEYKIPEDAPVLFISASPLCER